MKTALAIILSVLIATAASAATITLEVDTRDQVFTSIEVYAANAPRDFDLAAQPVYAGLGEIVPGVGNLRHITIPGLIPGQTYKFVAMLVDGTNRSPISNVVQEKMPIVVIKLEAPGLKAIETGGE